MFIRLVPTASAFDFQLLITVFFLINDFLVSEMFIRLVPTASAFDFQLLITVFFNKRLSCF